MRKRLLLIPIVLVFVLVLWACGNEEAKTPEQTDEPVQIQEANEAETEKEVNNEATEDAMEVDPRLSEPTEDTLCEICNMKVYTKDHEMGVFSAQAIRPDGSVVFYDDIGCLLNDEYINDIENEKFVRDYNTLNWVNVEEATVVKTDLKSPMNWGYIFFKSKEDADAYIKEHEKAKITPLSEVREAAIERYKKKQEHSHGHESHEGGHMDNEMEENHMNEHHHE